MNSSSPIEPLNKVTIARGLFSFVESLPQNISTELGCLEDALTLLNAEPQNVSAALDELTRCYAHAHTFQSLHSETRPEV
ncbi:hypothetical protein MCEMSEM18_00210 [Comamonadaceae bacterium]